MSDKIGLMLWDLMMFVAFAYAFLVMHKIVKTTVVLKMIQQPNIFVRILIYIGVLTFGYLVVKDMIGQIV